jgi:protein TonB
MTNNQIMQADLLDILFENRNKEYGAYALRKNYDERLKLSLVICLSLTALLMLGKFFGKNHHANGTFVVRDSGVIINQYRDKMPEPDKPRAPSAPRTPASPEVRHVAIKIVPDNTVFRTDVPDIRDLGDALPSDRNFKGDTTVAIVKTPVIINGDNRGNTGNDDKPFIPTQKDARFPGGNIAFAEFLKDHLITPDELETGERKTVLVRFKIDTDGNISGAEIIEGAGGSYDREVLRVLRKMPRWIPAEQNGMKVAVYFTQPVSFVRSE